MTDTRLDALTEKTAAQRRVTLIANELRGFVPVGGMGTATTFLALALARVGHSVEILRGWRRAETIDPYWETVYAQAGIRVRAAPREKRVEPVQFASPHDVELALRADPPDVVIAHDLAAPAYSALRMRQLGLAFENTLFVVFCHGTRGWILDMSRRVGIPDLRHVLATSVLERASIELADVVVSPSAYLVEWMRYQGWSLPERTLVIPYFTRSAATGEPTAKLAQIDDSARVERLTFFGRLEEKKGVRPFIGGLNTVDPALLAGLELEFLGKATATWTSDRVEGLLSDRTKQALRNVSFETELDQPEALARLSRIGTLAVIPSLGDNSPNTVYECLERGIPFIASDAGGIPELIAQEDRDRVLFDPTAEGVEAAIRGVLSGSHGLRPARPAFDSATSFERWAEVLAVRPHAPTLIDKSEGLVDVIVVHRGSAGAPPHCLSALEHQSNVHFDVTIVNSERTSVEAARQEGLRATSAPFVLFLDGDDVPDGALLTTLVRAQRTSGADVVTCGLRLVADRGDETLQLFSGEPGALGVLSNDYGNVALLRRSLLADLDRPRPGEGDPDWPLLAALSVLGARIVSVPLPLVTRSSRPGSVERTPVEALLVLHQIERGLSDPLRVTARLVAGLAAAPPAQRFGRSDSVLRRAREILGDEGPSQLARRSLRRLWRGGRHLASRR